MAIATQRPLDAGIAAYRRIALAREGRMRGACLVFDDGFAARTSRHDGNGKSARVLIVDGDPASRMLCAINLQIEGLVVLQATDGRFGLEQARSERPDLVLTDVMMRGLNGFQFAEALRGDERTRQIPLVFISAETAPANAARARELGALAYVTKPCDFPALALLIAGLAFQCSQPGGRIMSTFEPRETCPASRVSRAVRETTIPRRP